MSNLERFAQKKDKGNTPKKYNPDQAPDGYSPMTWRLMRNFIAGSLVWSTKNLEPKKFIIYQQVDYYLGLYSMPRDQETEVLVSEMFADFWKHEYENNPIDEMFNPLTWEKTRRIVLNHRESARISAVLDAGAQEPVEVEKIDRPPKPPRHKLGRPTAVGELTDFGPEVREFIKRHEEKQEDE